MSVASEVPSSRGASASSADTACAHCGAPLTDDQEWCLECGTARTVIHRPPDWRIPLALVVAVVVLVLAALAIVLINLSDSADRSSQTSAAQTSAAPTPSTAGRSPSAARAAATIPDWPVGPSGWTVVLSRSRSHASADAIARRLTAAGTRAGVLNSSQHPGMPRGYWVVYSARYPNRTRADAAAAELRARGESPARARKVG